MNRDPLFELYKMYGIDFSTIKEVEFGSVYYFITHSNNNSGVAATLDNGILEIPSQLDLNIFSHRSFLLAYYNSVFNEIDSCSVSTDLIREMKLNPKEKVSMIGNFRPIVKSLISFGIHPYVFDDFCEAPEVLHPSEKDPCIYSSDVLIMTATSIINRSFYSELQRIGHKTRVYLLGPSSLMIPYFKKEYGIEHIFGSIITDKDSVKKTIMNGGGVPSFSKFITKVMF